MSLSRVITALVALAFGVVLWFIFDRDANAIVEFLKGHGSTVLIMVQLIVVFILASTRHVKAAATVLALALITSILKVVV